MTKKEFMEQKFTEHIYVVEWKENGEIHKEPISFFPYYSPITKETTYFESPVVIDKLEMTYDDFIAYMKDLYNEAYFEDMLELEKEYYINGVYYQFDYPQCLKIISDDAEIISAKGMSEIEYLKSIV